MYLPCKPVSQQSRGRQGCTDQRVAWRRAARCFPHRCNALDKLWRVVHKPVFKRDHPQRATGAQQFTRLQQKVGARRFTHCFITSGKRLVQQHTAGRDTLHQRGQQRPPHVVCDHHTCKRPPGKGPRPGFDVGADFFTQFCYLFIFFFLTFHLHYSMF